MIDPDEFTIGNKPAWQEVIVINDLDTHVPVVFGVIVKSLHDVHVVALVEHSLQAPLQGVQVAGVPVEKVPDGQGFTH